MILYIKNNINGYLISLRFCNKLIDTVQILIILRNSVQFKKVRIASI